LAQPPVRCSAEDFLVIVAGKKPTPWSACHAFAKQE
jgi:hypothetical protein